MTSLYANRRYFTSIRPGSGNRTLLNVNTATSAFFKPISVTDFERNLEHEEGRPKHYSRRQVERLLRGKVLRIAYERPQLAGKPDPDLDHHRLKVFQNFGQSPPSQIFTNKQTGTKINVQAGYRECGIELKYPNWPHVNVGIPGAKDSKTGGLWIPGELLEIVPNQFVGETLSKTHNSDMMKHALRKPFESVNYIFNEGLYFLEISPDRVKSGMLMLWSR
ncbi:uncharacterized protein BDZ99DRAFT_112736 [Mytilinidion resinicola]|uniref:Uncharacterized protein n=1 Tax=Mytilinidion resinicola TaxID=574789 RepID=A0A6A6Y8E3_9PEZI|nr:uncharacterized protein BDZ99DRAFT_112736 [Mytilinidion resinicola]KAF2805082.1 hypothetical protein BDZ99DRAFT_112736 [Mytilinidion resinicola]